MSPPSSTLLRLALGNLAHQALAGLRVAVPAVGRLPAIGMLAGCEQGGLHHGAPAGGLGSLASIILQLPGQPALLIPAQKAACRILQGRAFGRVHGAGAGLALGAAGLQIAVLAAVQQMQLASLPHCRLRYSARLESCAAMRCHAAACFRKKPARPPCVLPESEHCPRPYGLHSRFQPRDRPR
jgi:hypothetical protein